MNNKSKLQEFIKALKNYGFIDLVKYDSKGKANYYEIELGIKKAINKGKE